MDMGIGIGMTLGVLEQRLKEAERHIVDGKKHVEQQRLVMERLVGGGHKTHEARRLLHLLEDLLVLHMQNRDRIRAEMRRRFNTVFK